MAVCRWSDYKCDLYIYESSLGIECHVASKRRVNEPPPPSYFDSAGLPSWLVSYQEYHAALDSCEIVPIGLSHDGESEAFADYGELLEYVRELREEGYLVPEWVIETIVIEQALGEGS